LLKKFDDEGEKMIEMIAIIFIAPSILLTLALCKTASRNRDYEEAILKEEFDLHTENKHLYNGGKCYKATT
jgi:hypothetical protein